MLKELFRQSIENFYENILACNEFFAVTERI